MTCPSADVTGVFEPRMLTIEPRMLTGLPPTV